MTSAASEGTLNRIETDRRLDTLPPLTSGKQYDQTEKRATETEHFQRKANNPDLIKNRPGKERANRTDNVNFLATELTNKIKKVEELMKSLKNKESESYPCVFTDSLVKGRDIEKRKIRNNRNHTRRSNRRREKRN